MWFWCCREESFWDEVSKVLQLFQSFPKTRTSWVCLQVSVFVSQHNKFQWRFLYDKTAPSPPQYNHHDDNHWSLNWRPLSAGATRCSSPSLQVSSRCLVFFLTFLFSWLFSTTESPGDMWVPKVMQCLLNCWLSIWVFSSILIVSLVHVSILMKALTFVYHPQYLSIYNVFPEEKM